MSTWSSSGNMVQVVTAADVGLSLRAYITATISTGTTVIVTESVLCRRSGFRNSRYQVARTNGNAAESELPRGDAHLDVGRSGHYPLVLASPQGVQSAEFARLSTGAVIRTIVLDRDGCGIDVSGGSFANHPLYKRLRTLFPKSTILGFPALVPRPEWGPRAERLDLRDRTLVVCDIERRNVHLGVERRMDAPIAQVVRYVQQHLGQPGIIFGVDRNHVYELCTLLQRIGIRAALHHDYQADHEPYGRVNQIDRDQADVILAIMGTVQGVDRTDFGYVLHAAMPRSLGLYLQDIRVAARGPGCPRCTILYSRADVRTWTSIMGSNGRANHYNMPIRQLHAMDAYCRTDLCRHAQIIRHFISHYGGAEAVDFSCYHCDACMKGRRPSFGNGARPRLVGSW